MKLTQQRNARFIRQPAILSSVIALLFGILVFAFLAETSNYRQLWIVVGVGVLSFMLGGRLWHRDHRLFGVIFVFCGSGLLLGAIGYAATQPSQLVDRFELLPGVIGVWILAGGLVPIRFRWSRLFIDSGTGILFIAVLTSGVVQGTSMLALVIAGTATILAWDAAENAVSLGRQVGAYSILTSVRAEGVHVSLSGIVAGSVIVVVLGVNSLGIEGIPFAALLALLVGVIALVLTNHR